MDDFESMADVTSYAQTEKRKVNGWPRKRRQPAADSAQQEVQRHQHGEAADHVVRQLLVHCGEDRNGCDGNVARSVSGPIWLAMARGKPMRPIGASIGSAFMMCFLM